MKVLIIIALMGLTACSHITYDTAYTFEKGSSKVYVNDPLPIFEDTLPTTPGNYRGYIWLRCNY